MRFLLPVTAANGCVISVGECPSVSSMEFQNFFDQEGHDALQTNSVEAACHLRAQDYGNFCEHRETSEESSFRQDPRPRAVATFQASGFSHFHSKNSCEPGWISYGGNCYFYSEDRVTFAEANARCAAIGASLASVHSDGENGLISYLSRGVRTWIGAVTRVSNDFSWTDESSKDYSNWAGDCAGCGEQEKAQQWYDAKPEELSGFVCKKKAVSENENLQKLDQAGALAEMLKIWNRLPTPPAEQKKDEKTSLLSSPLFAAVSFWKS